MATISNFSFVYLHKANTRNVTALKTHTTTVDYKGFLITPKVVLLTHEDNDEEYTVAGSTTAYQIVYPASGYIYGTVSSIERAYKMIDKHGERWRQS